VSKLSFTLSSLVAVIPAVFMMYLLIMGFIAGMPTMLIIFAGLAVVCGVGVVLLPVLSFIMGPKTEEAPEAAEAATGEEAVEKFEDFGEEVEGEEFEDISAEDDFGEEMETFEDVEFGGDDEWGDFEDDDEFKDG
jgi:hypothetical protein